MIQTRQRIDYRSGKATIIHRTSLGYDRLMQVVADQAMQRAMVQITKARHLSVRSSTLVRTVD